MFKLVKICQEKEFLCIHDDINNLIESALDSKLLLINSNSQHLEKKEQEVKNVVEQPAEHGNHSIQSLQNFRVVHKSSISFKDTSQISSIHSVAHIQSTKEPEHLLSMGYEHLSITPETESDKVTESNTENLLPIPSKYEDNDDLKSSDDESLPDEDVPVEEFKIYSNPLCDKDEINSDKLDPHCFNVESDFVESLLNRDTFIDFSSKFDFSEDLNAEITDTIIETIPLLPIPVQDGNSQQKEIDIVTETDDVLPSSVENEDDLLNDSLLEEGDLFLVSDDSIPSEPLDDDFDLEPEVISAVMKDIDEPDEHFNPGGEIFVSTNNEDVDYFPFMFVIRIFLPYLILLEISPLLLSAESEDTIFDPEMSTFVLCVGCGEPLYGFSPFRWCTCEWCGNDLLDGFCSLCNSRNSCVYDPNPNSFDCPPNSYHPPHPTYETYSCDSCVNDSHFGYDCQPQFPLNYESELGYIENYNSYPYDSSSFPQQYLCCENYGGPHENFQCQPMNQNFYKPNMCSNSISSYFDQFQPSHFPVIHQPSKEMSIQEMEDLKQQYLDEMKRLINSEYRDEIKIDELKGNFNKSDEFINSSVENLVPIPSESDDFSDIESECDMPDCDDSQTINFSTFSNPLFEDFTSSDDESSHEESYLLESLVNRDTLMASSPKFDSLLDEFSGELAHTDLIPPGINKAFYDNHVKKISSGSTTTHFDSSLYDSSDFYEFADELTHIISPSKYDCVCFKIEPNSGDFTMDVVEDTFPTKEPRVHNALTTHPTFQLNPDFILSSESIFAYIVCIFLFFLSYSVAPEYLLSFGNEDTIFDLDICSYHISSCLPDVSHRSGTFTKFKVLNESPMEILISTCSPMDQ
nr:hypothetical protein [Tanacetum cinerariifolium]